MFKMEYQIWCDVFFGENEIQIQEHSNIICKCPRVWTFDPTLIRIKYYSIGDLKCDVRRQVL